MWECYICQMYFSKPDSMSFPHGHMTLSEEAFSLKDIPSATFPETILNSLSVQQTVTRTKPGFTLIPHESRATSISDFALQLQSNLCLDFLTFYTLWHWSWSEVVQEPFYGWNDLGQVSWDGSHRETWMWRVMRRVLSQVRSHDAPVWTGLNSGSRIETWTLDNN